MEEKEGKTRSKQPQGGIFPLEEGRQNIPQIPQNNDTAGRFWCCLWFPPLQNEKANICSGQLTFVCFVFNQVGGQLLPTLSQISLKPLVF